MRSILILLATACFTMSYISPDKQGKAKNHGIKNKSAVSHPKKMELNDKNVRPEGKDVFGVQQKGQNGKSQKPQNSEHKVHQKGTKGHSNNNESLKINPKFPKHVSNKNSSERGKPNKNVPFHGSKNGVHHPKNPKKHSSKNGYYKSYPKMQYPKGHPNYGYLYVNVSGPNSYRNYGQWRSEQARKKHKNYHPRYEIHAVEGFNLIIIRNRFLFAETNNKIILVRQRLIQKKNAGLITVVEYNTTLERIYVLERRRAALEIDIYL